MQIIVIFYYYLLIDNIKELLKQLKIFKVRNIIVKRKKKFFKNKKNT